eukprot:4657025-Pyramimonas_sp.AAC.1
MVVTRGSRRRSARSSCSSFAFSRVTRALLGSLLACIAIRNVWLLTNVTTSGSNEAWADAHTASQVLSPPILHAEPFDPRKRATVGTPAELDSSDEPDADPRADETNRGAAPLYAANSSIEGIEQMWDAIQDSVKAGDFTNGSDDLFLTKSNHKRLRPTKRIKREALLPEVVSNYTYNTCALVGNSGGMLTASHGSAIDKLHEAVMRINQAPIHPYSMYVGKKTTFRLLNKKWVSVYGDKTEGQEGLLPVEAPNATLILSRAASWQMERVAAMVRRERPDITVLMLSNDVITRVRKVLTTYRSNAQRVLHIDPYGNGTSPSSALIGLFVLMQFCKSVSVYGVGEPYTSWESSARLNSVDELSPPLSKKFRRYNLGTYQEMARAAYKRKACAEGANIKPKFAPYSLIKGFPAPYHYFVRWFDSTKLMMHPSHAFDLENDFLYSLQAAVPHSVTFCPPADPCLGAAANDPCNKKQFLLEQSSETDSVKTQYQALNTPMMPWMIKSRGHDTIPAHAPPR